ncbi:MAG: lysophospholipid acyltransferase family protein [Pirellulaceae bacterium]
MKLGGLAITAVTRGWMGTLDYQAVFYDPDVDPASRDFQGPAIFLFWHEYIPFLFYLRGNCHIAMLLSQHQDAEWLSQAARHMGFGTVRGSTSRGGVSALRELMRTSATMNLTITPDGPRGPRRRLAAGCIYASSRLGIPLVPIGLGYDRPWRSRRAWDQFAVPRPYSRARAVAGPKVQIPRDVGRDGVEYYRQRVERLLNALTSRAEQWAESGTRISGQRPACRQGAAGRLASGGNKLPPPLEAAGHSVHDGNSNTLRIA